MVQGDFRSLVLDQFKRLLERAHRGGIDGMSGHFASVLIR